MLEYKLHVAPKLNFLFYVITSLHNFAFNVKFSKSANHKIT